MTDMHGTEEEFTWQYFAETMDRLYEDGYYDVVWQNDKYMIFYFSQIPTFATLVGNLANYYCVCKLTEKLEWGVSSYSQLERMIETLSEEDSNPGQVSEPSVTLN